tara:strand:- start:447 stop:677 length:231 start_codon:yes stop_codon:yes gene_type:complete
MAILHLQKGEQDVLNLERDEHQRIIKSSVLDAYVNGKGYCSNAVKWLDEWGIEVQTEQVNSLGSYVNGIINQIKAI